MAVSLSRLLRGALLPATALLAASPSWAQTQAQVPATLLDPVTTIGTKTERRVEDIPSSVRVIGQEEIDRRFPSKVDNLISDIPGVEMNGGPRRNAQDVFIRGLGGNRVVTTVDGVRNNFDSSGHKGRIFNDPDLLKQVEVLKGPASALRGSGAIGGVLALTTKDAADFLEADEKYAFKGKYGYRSAAREPLYSATHVGRPVKEFDYLANLTYRPGGTIRQGGDRELNDSSEVLRSGLYKFGVNPAENHRVALTHQVVRDTARVPLAVDGSTNLATGNPATRHLIENTTTSLNYNYRNPDGGWVNPTMSIYENKFHITDDYIATGNAIRFDATDLLTTGYDVYNTSYFNGAGAHAVTYGVEYFKDDQVGYRNGILRAPFPRSERDVYGYYVQDEITLGDFSLIPGVRYDTYEQTNGVNPQSESKLSPKLGGIWRALPWLSPFASYAQGFRAPSLTELYIGGTSPPAHTFVANPNLKPEESETVEAGLRFKFNNLLADRDRLIISTSVFRTEAENFIDAVTTSNTITFRNITKANIQGAEAEAMYDMARAFAGAGVSYVRGSNETNSQPISSMPADKLTLTAGGKAPEYDLVYGMRSQLVARQDHVDSTSTTERTGGYAIHGIFASWVPSSGVLSGFRFDAGIDNLFDKLYRRHNTTLYEEGRDYRGAVSYTMKF